jgi:predicted mannosyl-3-phosphoglycerate phosphatase (HAD superfamily)
VLQAHESVLNTQLRKELQKVQQLRHSLEEQLTATHASQHQSGQSQNWTNGLPGSAAGDGTHGQTAGSMYSTATEQQQQQQQRMQVFHVQCVLVSLLRQLAECVVVATT